MRTKSKVALAACAAAVGYVAADIYKNASIKPMPEHAPKIQGRDINELLLCFERPVYAEEKGIVIDAEYIEDAISAVKQIIDGRYDCVDFRMQSLIRLAYSYGDKIKAISPRGWELLEQTFLGAKFWMTEPGEDSACYWSENHQLLYASAEYLAGQMWKNRVFFNDGATGAEHMRRALKRIECWTHQRFYHGYSEFNSSNYYLFSAAPALNFIQFAKGCEETKERLRMSLDLLFYDIACGMYDYVFILPNGRAYSYNLAGGDCDRVRKLTDYVWGLNDNYKTSTHHMLINIVLAMEARDENGRPYYEVPKAILEIGRDKSERVIKSSTGLDTAELKAKGLVGHEDYQIMCQLGMEAFTNPEVIYNTYTYLKKNKMFSSSMLNFFKFLNVKGIRNEKTMTWVSSALNPMPNGIAIQRANLCRYRTAYYMLASVQKYHPGGYGAQQFLSCANFGGNSIVFTNHPANDSDKKSTSKLPGYWAGFGRAPHIAQEKNVQLMIFDIPKISGFLELYRVPQYTHTFLPEAFFDEVCVDGCYAFARKDGGFIALIGSGNLSYLEFDEESASALEADLKHSSDKHYEYVENGKGAEQFASGPEKSPDKHFDLVQRGNHQSWIYELSDETKESFEAFKARIRENSVVFDGKHRLLYKSGGITYELDYGGDFTVDGKVVSPQFKRFESDYINAEREADVFNFSFDGHGVTLDFENALRKYD